MDRRCQENAEESEKKTRKTSKGTGNKFSWGASGAPEALQNHAKMILKLPQITILVALGFKRFGKASACID